MKVYIVVIGSSVLNGRTVVGACYTLEESAKREVERLNKANSFVRATYVARTVEEHGGRAPLA